MPVLTRPLPQLIPITYDDSHDAPVAHFGEGIAGLKRFNFLHAVEIDKLAAVKRKRRRMELGSA